MKKLVFLFAVLCAAGILLSCEPNVKNISTDEGQEVAVNPAADYYFMYPSNWTLDKNAAMITVFCTDDSTLESDVSSGEDKMAIFTYPNISGTVMGIQPGKYGSVADYWNLDYYPLLESQFSNIMVSEPTDTVLDGIPALRYDYTADIAGITFAYSQTIAIQGDNVYTLTYTCEPAKRDLYAEAYDLAVSSFRFK